MAPSILTSRAQEPARPRRVAVVGTGLAGLTAAYLLSNAEAEGQFEVTVFDAAPRPGMAAYAMTVPCGCAKCQLAAGKAGKSEQPLCTKKSHAAMVASEASESGDRGKHVAEQIDSPLRSFNRGYYPTMLSLFRHLEVPLRKVNFSISISRLIAATSATGGSQQPSDSDGSFPVTPVGTYDQELTKTMDEHADESDSTEELEVDPQPVFTDNLVHLTWLDMTLRLPSWLLRPWTQRQTPTIMREYARFVRSARALRSRPGALADLRNVTLGEYLETNGYTSVFIQGVLLPVVATMLSAPHKQVLAMPAAATLDWAGRKRNAVLGVPQGVQEVCERLLEAIPKERKRFGCPIKSLQHHKDVAACRDLWTLTLADGTSTEFDLVILATPPPVSAALVKPSGAPHANEVAALLERFRHEPVNVVVHDDAAAVLPPSARDVRGINLAANSAATMATVHVNQLRELPSHCGLLLQTTLPMTRIAPDRVRGAWRFPRARLDCETQTALTDLYAPGDARATGSAMQGAHGLFMVGSSLFPGMPLLEGCVSSALHVAGILGATRPWKAQPGEYVGKFDGDDIVDAYYRGELFVDGLEAIPAPLPDMLAPATAGTNGKRAAAHAQVSCDESSSRMTAAMWSGLVAMTAAAVMFYFSWWPSTTRFATWSQLDVL